MGTQYEIKMGYVIRYRNKPKYKGLDAYVISPEKTTSKLEEATLFTKDNTVEYLAKRYILDSYHELAEKVECYQGVIRYEK